MSDLKRKWRVNLVDVLVGLAVLMILSALVVPVFIPSDGRAASRAATSSVSAQAGQH
jgi:type II secretory pathway pseudopilin PulG